MKHDFMKAQIARLSAYADFLNNNNELEIDNVDCSMLKKLDHATGKNTIYEQADIPFMNKQIYRLQKGKKDNDA